MKLRAARLSDIGALLEIERESFTTDRLTARKLRHLLTRGNCELVVADERGRLAGYALVLFRRRASAARLYGLAVAADLRGRGVGRMLLREAERRARTRGALRMTLETNPRSRAVRLYESEGYVLAERLGPYYEDGTPADRYAKPVRASRP